MIDISAALRDPYTGDDIPGWYRLAEAVAKLDPRSSLVQFWDNGCDCGFSPFIDYGDPDPGDPEIEKAIQLIATIEYKNWKDERANFAKQSRAQFVGRERIGGDYYSDVQVWVDARTGEESLPPAEPDSAEDRIRRYRRTLPAWEQKRTQIEQDWIRTAKDYLTQAGYAVVG